MAAFSNRTQKLDIGVGVGLFKLMGQSRAPTLINNYNNQSWENKHYM